MIGTCMTCGRDCESMFSDEGYSPCCNDRIAYGLEAADVKNRIRFDDLLDSGQPKVEILGSWAQVTGEGVIIERKLYFGRPAALILDEDGCEGLFVDSENRYRVIN